MKACALVCCCLLLVVAALAASGSTQVGPITRTPGTSLDTQWGPDGYGYIARDSNEPSGPAYQWYDITETGTEVTGLGDDNFVGPFPIGWDFHYYWYDVSQFWIGSNGYIKFNAAGQYTQAFTAFPNQAAPNNAIGPYMADWFFGAPDPSECYYWTNNTDTLIVSWENVTAWMASGNTGNHNFQLILSAVDSSITFIYGPQTGLVANTSISNGIENITGQLGISTRFNAYPTANTAIKFEYPDVVTYVAHDFAPTAALNETSGGIFMLPADSLYPWVRITNIGNQFEDGAAINVAVRQTNNTLLASYDLGSGQIEASESVEMTFPYLWTATGGNYKFVVTSGLDNDIYAGNNVLTTEVHVVVLPGELAYDDGSSNQDWGWDGGNGGMGMQFVPPTYPVDITQLRIYVSTTDPGGFTALVLDDDGENGSPGTVLYEAIVLNPTANAWANVPVEDIVTIEDGSFYVAWMQNVEGITFGVDTTSSQGISRRAWEYTGIWSESRMSETGDAMIRCSIAESAAPNQPPGAFNMLFPGTEGDSLFRILEPRIYWQRSIDPDDDLITYLASVESDYPPFEDITIVTTDTFADLDIPIPTTLDEWWSFTITLRATDAIDTIDATNSPQTLWVDIPESADDRPAGLVTEYALSAYPNPFNPTTAIRYDLPQASEMELAVFNLMGEKVATLVSGRHEMGRHTATWNAVDQASGTYFAVLRTPTATRVSKILLLK